MLTRVCAIFKTLWIGAPRHTNLTKQHQLPRHTILRIIALIWILLFVAKHDFYLFNFPIFSGSGGSGKTFTAHALVQHLLEQAGGGQDSDICKVSSQCLHRKICSCVNNYMYLCTHTQMFYGPRKGLIISKFSLLTSHL